jgi:hypothetical protein
MVTYPLDLLPLIRERGMQVREGIHLSLKSLPFQLKRVD